MATKVKEKTVARSLAALEVSSVAVEKVGEGSPVNLTPMSADSPEVHDAYRACMAPVENLRTGLPESKFSAKAFREKLEALSFTPGAARSICDAFILRHKATLSVRISYDTQGREHVKTDRLTGNVSEAIRKFHEERKANLKALQMSEVKAGRGRLLAYCDTRKVS